MLHRQVGDFLDIALSFMVLYLGVVIWR